MNWSKLNMLKENNISNQTNYYYTKTTNSMSTIVINKIYEKYDKVLNETFFEVWIDDPFTSINNLHKKHVLPMYAKSIKELRDKMQKAIVTRDLIAKRRKQCSLYGGKFSYQINDFQFLLSENFGSGVWNHVK